MRFLILIFIFIKSTLLFGQSKYENIRLSRDNFPSYVIANESDTLGIIFTISDVQKIDNKLELLEYLEGRTNKLDTTLYYYVSLSEDLELKNDLLKSKVVDLTSKISKKDSTISDLKSRVLELTKLDIKNQEIKKNDNVIIDEKDKQIKKEKTIRKLITAAAVILLIITSVQSGS